MPTVDYLPVATAGGANVDSQADFAGSGYQTDGFQVGIALPQQANKVWRQSSMIAAMIATFISQTLNINVLDDGNLSALLANFVAALGGADSAIDQVPFSASPNFDESVARTFEITLTGNVISSSVANVVNGSILKFIIHQDAVGGRTFVWPAGVPGDTIDPGASVTSVQAFIVDGSGVFHPYTAMIAR